MSLTLRFERKKRDAVSARLRHIGRMKSPEVLSRDTMTRAFAARDRGFDGRFVVGVTSTGIYCRPSCPARRPRPENMRFFGTVEEAREAGFRACKRCRPDDVARDAAATVKAIAILRRSDERLSLKVLAEECGYSPGHLQRVFKQVTGLSPAAYARALQSEAARDALAQSDTVTEAIYAAGYAAPSRFYAEMEGKLGMTPSAWAKGGDGVTIHWAIAQTSLGAMLVAATAKGVCRLSFEESGEALRERFPKATIIAGGDAFADLLARVVKAVETPQLAQAADIPLDVQGTAFQERVWAALKTIPPGETRSYGELAAALGQPKASRAVGGANGANPVAVLVPCHRVVAADGGLGGYAYGTEIKEELLRRERGED